MDDDNAFEEWLQAALEKEREATKLMLEERDRQTQMLMEEERAHNNAQTKAKYDLFAVSARNKGWPLHRRRRQTPPRWEQ